MVAKNKMQKNVIYYRDELKDDFADAGHEPICVDASFPYLHESRLWNLCAVLVYRGIMTPIAFLHTKLRFGLRIKGREKLKACKGQGCFLYSNHTLMAADAYIPNLVSFPRRTYVVVNAVNLSQKGTRNWVQMSGALPLPTKLSGMRSFLAAMETRLKQGYCIQIYPEAHIWPYYTRIRPFGAESFRYPVRLNAPVFCTTTTFQKKRFGKTPRVTVWVDGPFYADEALPVREREQALRNAVYETMCERAKASTYAPIQYVKIKEDDHADPDPVCGE